MVDYKIFYIICIVILFGVILNKQNIERFISDLVLYEEEREKQHKLTYNEIFPLKKYKFYNRYVWGPAKTDYLLQFYHNKKYDPMKYMKYPYPNTNIYKKLVSFKPADINLKNYRYKQCTKDTKRCVWPSNNETLRKKNPYTNSKFIPNCCANHLTEMLFYLHDLFKKHKITYFIYWGTLLGSIRHGGIIPVDEDIDIHVLKKDYTKLVKLKPYIQNTTHYNLVIDRNRLALCFSKLNHQHVDIFYYEQT
jgi:hypothetical protein